MNILLDDLPFNESLYPFGAVKSMAHIRIGILTIHRKMADDFHPGEIFLVLKLIGDHVDENFI